MILINTLVCYKNAIIDITNIDDTDKSLVTFLLISLSRLCLSKQKKNYKLLQFRIISS